MIRTWLRKNRRLVPVLTMLAIPLVAPLFQASSAYAGNTFERGYFHNNDLADAYTKNLAVLNNGLPTSYQDNTDKIAFINYIRDIYNATESDGTSGINSRSGVGAAYIIQTMRGGTDLGAPSAADVQQWVDLVKQDNVTLEKGTYSDRYTSDYFRIGTTGARDVAKHDKGKGNGSNDPALLFKQNGVVVYAIRYQCGNPVGDLPGLKQQNQWTISDTVSVNKTTMLPNDTATWTHTVTNNGPDATDKAIDVNTNTTGSFTATTDLATIATNMGNGVKKTYTSTYKAKDSDLGNKICRDTRAQPKAWNNSGVATPASGSPACVSVPYNYDLTPHATFGGGLAQAVPAGGTGPAVSKNVFNGGLTLSKPTTWQLVKCTYAANVGAATYNATYGDSTSSFPTGGCGTVQNGNNLLIAKNSTVGINPDLPGEVIPANTAAGTHICYVLAINPPSSSAANNVWRHSAPACLSVTKYPKVQVYNGDVSAQTVLTHAAGLVNGKYYGSWGEYGIFGVGGITGMASAAKYANGGASDASNVVNPLSFANTGTPAGNFGGAAPSTQAYVDAYNAIAGPGVSGNVGGAVGPGDRTVYHAGSSITITSNITYPGSYGSVTDIPRVVYVVNGDIYINANVTQIDAWLIATGTIYTCSDFRGSSTPITLSQCANQLTFNGPVNAGKLILGRTAGADASSSDPGQAGEIFNLAPSNFLSNYSISTSSTNIQTVYEKELPPRW